MIDVHCHIDLYPNPMEIVQECEANNIITIGVTNLPSHFEQGYSRLLHCKKVRLALGMHPLYAKFHEMEFPAFIKNLSLTSYIGEVGLDFSKDGITTKDIQMESFRRILTLIKDKKKLLSIHSRNAEKEVLQFLKEYDIQSAIFHWYTGPVNLIAEIADAGYYFSINMAMVKSARGREVIEQIPLDRVLTETDGPFIEHNGKMTRPSDVSAVEAHLSEIRGFSSETVSQIIRKNFLGLLSNIK